MKKLDVLKENISKLEGLTVAYSGGVDSSFLMAVAHEVLGPEKVMGIFVSSPLNPQRDQYEAQVIAEIRGWKIKTLTLDPWKEEKISQNTSQRCYYCKRTIFQRIIKEANKLEYKNIADGTNIDDEGDFRPGIKALGELDVLSPLRDAKLTKEEIRKLSKEVYNLPTWNKPSAACLASRIPYGTELTEGNLRKVDEAEDHLHGLGYQNCRVRYHGNLCRIELMPEDFDKFMHNDRHSVDKALKDLGFIYITLDIAGYRTGSANLVLEEK